MDRDAATDGFGGRRGLSLRQTPDVDAPGWPSGHVLVDLSREPGAGGHLERLARGHAEIALVGVPTAEVVAAARAAGARRVAWLATDAQLRTSGRLAEAIAAGLTDLHVWLHAADAAAHDFHAGAGSFAVVAEALTQARGEEIGSAVSTLLTRSSARVLTAMPGWLQRHGVRAWRIATPSLVVRPRVVDGKHGDAGATDRAIRVAGVGPLDGLLPRLSVALPHALQAVAHAARVGLPAWIGGAPVCLLGPFVAAALPEPARAFARVCGGCPARAACPGVDAGYLERFAGDELSPAQLRPPGARPAGSAWLFLGTGLLVHVETDRLEGAGPKGQVARRLPVFAGAGDGR